MRTYKTEDNASKKYISTNKHMGIMSGTRKDIIKGIIIGLILVIGSLIYFFGNPTLGAFMILIGLLVALLVLSEK
ncbi:MAG: hypothetical protein U9O53_01995 [archaeon]|nr:hypothetical protein [archaeon]